MTQDSAFEAGYRLLALMLSFSLGAILSSVLTEKRRIPPMFVFMAGAVFQILGLGLMTRLPTTDLGFPPEQYGYQFIMGFGFGLSIATLIMTIHIVVDHEDNAVTMGATAQARTLGGSVGISICTNLLNSHIKNGLRGRLDQRHIQDLLASARAIANISDEMQAVVRRVYAEGYREQVVALTAFAGAALLVVLMMWERRPRRIPKPEQ